MSLILATTPPERRHGAVRAWTAVGGAAAALGPVVGGLLVALCWRWVFLVNVPIGLVALWVGWRRLPRVPGHDVPNPDALGALLATAGVGALTLGLVQGEHWGWGSAQTIAALGVAVVALGAFVAHTLHHRNPLIEPALFRPRPSAAAASRWCCSRWPSAPCCCRSCCGAGGWGWSALRTGLAIAPGPLMVPIFGLLVAGRLIGRSARGRWPAPARRCSPPG